MEELVGLIKQGEPPFSKENLSLAFGHSYASQNSTVCSYCLQIGLLKTDEYRRKLRTNLEALSL